ncbi:MAG: UDP-galactopyranose mutase [Ruminococcus sp.]|jgi:UDP-galactopyranose mutase
METNMKYDYLIVGAGLFGSVFAREASRRGYRCLVVDRRSHIGGNVYTEETEGIQVHKYGAHIFHTSNREIWEYIRQFGEFNHFVNSPIAVYHDELYNLPFNMNTFSRMWNIRTPEEAQKKIREQIASLSIENPRNLEEQALSLVGRDVYEKLVKEYTEKQWGRKCTELPAFIIRRLPLRFTYDNNYFNDPYQGIPKEGYTKLVERMLEGIPVKLNTDFKSLDRTELAKKTVYTGMIDEYFDYRLGVLEYRSLRFEEEKLPCENYQGNAVVNYTSHDVPYTRIIEHKHFDFGHQPTTVITREYPKTWKQGDEPYYPINDERNTRLYEKYQKLAEEEQNVLFGGRLGMYRYFDMDKVIEAALSMADRELR